MKFTTARWGTLWHVHFLQGQNITVMTITIDKWCIAHVALVWCKWRCKWRRRGGTHRGPSSTTQHPSHHLLQPFQHFSQFDPFIHFLSWKKQLCFHLRPHCLLLIFLNSRLCTTPPLSLLSHWFPFLLPPCVAAGNILLPSHLLSFRLPPSSFNSGKSPGKLTGLFSMFPFFRLPVNIFRCSPCSPVPLLPLFLDVPPVGQWVTFSDLPSLSANVGNLTLSQHFQDFF